jgi:hypothetical protein
MAVEEYALYPWCLHDAGARAMPDPLAVFRRAPSPELRRGSSASAPAADADAETVAAEAAGGAAAVDERLEVAGCACLDRRGPAAQAVRVVHPDTRALLPDGMVARS